MYVYTVQKTIGVLPVPQKKTKTYITVRIAWRVTSQELIVTPLTALLWQGAQSYKMRLKIYKNVLSAVRRHLTSPLLISHLSISLTSAILGHINMPSHMNLVVCYSTCLAGSQSLIFGECVAHLDNVFVTICNYKYLISTLVAEQQDHGL